MKKRRIALLKEKNRIFPSKNSFKNKKFLIILYFVFASLLLQPSNQNDRYALNSYGAQSKVCVAPLIDGNFMMLFECAGYLNDNTNYHMCAQTIDSSTFFKILDSRFTVRSNPFSSLACGVLSNGSIVVVIESSGDLFFIVKDSSLNLITNETNVHSQTLGNQRNASILPLLNNNFIILWESENVDGSGTGIVGKIYSNSITVSKSDFIINTSSNADQKNPCACVQSTGNFIVVWVSNHNVLYSNSQIYFQMFDPTGNMIGTESLANSSNLNDIINSPSIKCLNNDNFVISWTNYSSRDGSGAGIYARIFNDFGSALTLDFLINTTTLNDQIDSKIESLNSGGFIVVWNSYTQTGGEMADSSGYGVWMQKFDTIGNKIGNEHLLNTSLTGNQMNHYVQKLFNIGFYIIAWVDMGLTNSRVIYDELYLDRLPYKRFYANQSSSNVLALISGNFVIAWADILQNTKSYVKFKIIDSAENVLKDETIVNDHLGAYTDLSPMLAGFADGSFVLVWKSFSCSPLYTIKAAVFSSSGTMTNGITSLTSCDSTKYGTAISQIAVLTTSDSRIIISWTQSGATNDIMSDTPFQIFDKNLNLLVDLTRVYNNVNDGTQNNLKFCELQSTNNSKAIFATWTEASGRDVAGSAIMGRLYNFNLDAVIKSDFRINVFESSEQTNSNCKNISGNNHKHNIKFFQKIFYFCLIFFFLIKIKTR